MEPYLLTDAVVVGLVVGLVWALVSARRSRVWRDAGRELLRRRPLALAVFLLYVAIGLLDSLAWVSGSSAGVTAGGDTVSLHKPRSAIDRLFPDASFREKSYSAPLADREFLGGSPLRHPGRHLLGTDLLGRDVLYQTLKGARVALLVGGFTTLLVIPLALLFGVVAGYFGGRIDDAIFFLISTLASMPGLLLLIALIMVLGRGPVQVCVALGVTGWVGFARIVRGETLKLRELDYVQAARALGASDLRILLHHIVPNLMHLVVITFVLTFSGFVLQEAVLSWLGIGIDGSWGRMIDQARDELSREPIIWWNLVSASVALFGLILAVNLLGDGVRDILDPRTLRERA